MLQSWYVLVERFHISSRQHVLSYSFQMPDRSTFNNPTNTRSCSVNMDWTWCEQVYVGPWLDLENVKLSFVYLWKFVDVKLLCFAESKTDIEQYFECGAVSGCYLRQGCYLWSSLTSVKVVVFCRYTLLLTLSRTSEFLTVQRWKCALTDLCSLYLVSL